MKTRIKMLKVKIKSLAEEARIIRLEEGRSEPGSQQQSELHEHRVRDVRKEQRASLLAYAFLRGVPLAACEAKAATEPDWKRVLAIAIKFGPLAASNRDEGERFGQWRDGTARVEVA